MHLPYAVCAFLSLALLVLYSLYSWTLLVLLTARAAVCCLWICYLCWFVVMLRFNHECPAST